MSAHELTSIENTYCQVQVHVSREVDQYVIFSFKHVYETIELVSNKGDTTGQYQTLSKLPRETFGIPRKTRCTFCIRIHKSMQLTCKMNTMVCSFIFPELPDLSIV